MLMMRLRGQDCTMITRRQTSRVPSSRQSFSSTEAASETAFDMLAVCAPAACRCLVDCAELRWVRLLTAIRAALSSCADVLLAVALILPAVSLLTIIDNVS